METGAFGRSFGTHHSCGRGTVFPALKTGVFHRGGTTNANRDKQCVAAVEAPPQSRCIFAKNSLLQRRVRLRMLSKSSTNQVIRRTQVFRLIYRQFE